MPRLDVWLVEKGNFSSRQAAKRAIKKGLVLVNGKKCKPSSQVSENDIIELLTTECDVPQGYWKLKELDERIQNKLVCDISTALDIGSSAGGFLTYLAEKDVNTIGIEVSERFAEELHSIVERYHQISVIFDDAFNMDQTIIANEGQLGLLLVDVTTESEGTLRLIEKFTPLLKKGGRMLAAFKTSHSFETSTSLTTHLSQLGYEQIQEIILDKTRREIHIIGIYT